MAFKNLNDGSRRAALVPFLQSAELLTGACIVLAVDKRIKNFGGFEGIQSGMQDRRMLTAKWKSKSFRRMIGITHTVSAVISYLCRQGQNIYWISDNDDCFASVAHREDTRRMMEIFSSMHVNFPLGELIWSDVSTSAHRWGCFCRCLRFCCFSRTGRAAAGAGFGDD
jgi:hypothetical protein